MRTAWPGFGHCSVLAGSHTGNSWRCFREVFFTTFHSSYLILGIPDKRGIAMKRTERSFKPIKHWAAKCTVKIAHQLSDAVFALVTLDIWYALNDLAKQLFFI